MSEKTFAEQAKELLEFLATDEGRTLLDKVTENYLLTVDRVRDEIFMRNLAESNEYDERLARGEIN